ncbi:hypothetical protein D3C73_690270 [compost metagenome]
MLKSALGRLKFSGIIEGISFLVLLLIAMPLKYAADMPGPVAWIGPIHGFLFVVYLIAVAHATLLKLLTIPQALIAAIAAFLPFGPILFDTWLRKKKSV